MVYLTPAARPSAVLVFNQQMGRPNLALVAIHCRWFRFDLLGTVIRCHVRLQLLCVGSGRRLPS